MTIKARFRSACGSCGKPINAGESCEWVRGSAARHVDCHAAQNADDADGASLARVRPSGNRPRYGSRYTRFSSGAEVFTNARGRCEDAPCCGCCS